MKTIILILLSILLSLNIYSNNVSISDVTTTGKNTTDKYVMLKFNLSWENSWRVTSGPGNFDAVWLFAKFKNSSGNWEHCSLNTTSANHVNPSGTTLLISQTSSVGMGAFIYRSEDGSGNLNLSGIQLRWEYGDDAVTDTENPEVCVYAVEMVYIPEGDYELGDGDGTNETVYTFHDGSTNNNVTISTALVSDIQVDGGASNTWDDAKLTSTGIGIDGDAGIDTLDNGIVDNTGFPTGYTHFCIMKYEISQGQYANFLNKLTSTQQANRCDTSKYGDYRYSITQKANEYIATAPHRACNYLSWSDVAAYLDWAGLRPITELEFTKASRGTAPAQFRDYPWGEKNIVSGAVGASKLEGLVNDGEYNETASTNYANSHYWGGTGDDVSGPVRVGLFATATSTRVRSGASYYGVMELGGNVIERCISLGQPEGRTYTGIHGDGALDASGWADVTNWPKEKTTLDNDGNDTEGIIFKGGAWRYLVSGMFISNRNPPYDGSVTDNHNSSHRKMNYGGRGGRTP